MSPIIDAKSIIIALNSQPWVRRPLVKDHGHGVGSHRPCVVARPSGVRCPHAARNHSETFISGYGYISQSEGLLWNGTKLYAL